MHEAKSRLSELVKAVEKEGETVILQRHGTPVAELRRFQPCGQPEVDRLKTHPELRVEFAPDYHPAERFQSDELLSSFKARWSSL